MKGNRERTQPLFPNQKPVPGQRRYHFLRFTHKITYEVYESDYVFRNEEAADEYFERVTRVPSSDYMWIPEKLFGVPRFTEGHGAMDFRAVDGYRAYYTYPMKEGYEGE